MLFSFVGGSASEMFCGSQQYFVDGEVSGAAEGEGDDLGDVVGGDRGLAVHLLDTLARVRVGDVVRELGGDHARLDECDPYAGEQLLAQGLGPAVEAPLGRGVDAVAGSGGAAGDRLDVDDVTATLDTALLELVEEDLVAVIAPRRLTSIMCQ